MLKKSPGAGRQSGKDATALAANSMPLPADPVGAFCKANHAALQGASKGPLKGLSFAAKDLFHIRGIPTGFGNPTWLETHPIPRTTARAVAQLLEAGADLVAKAHCDELCYSLTGENVHYGTPKNINAPGRVPGGSSNGSAAAVAAGLCDFGLGSDCGGSVRIPASYCGLYGMRPTWGRVSLAGAVPFGPSFDVAGWLARDADVLSRVGSVLLGEPSRTAKPRRLLVARDAFSLLEPKVARAFAPAVDHVRECFPKSTEIEIAPAGFDELFDTFRTIQAFEIWRTLGSWVESAKPVFGPGVCERFEWASTVTPKMHADATRRRRAIRAHIKTLIEPGDVVCLPTSPRAAPKTGSPADEVEITYRNQAMRLLCISGLCGLPQMSLPLARIGGLPLGLSLLGAKGTDMDLLALAAAIEPMGLPAAAHKRPGKR